MVWPSKIKTNIGVHDDKGPPIELRRLQQNVRVFHILQIIRVRGYFAETQAMLQISESNPDPAVLQPLEDLLAKEILPFLSRGRRGGGTIAIKDDNDKTPR